MCYVFPVLWMTSYWHISWGCSTSPPGWGSEAHTQPWAWHVEIPVAGSRRSGLLLGPTSWRVLKVTPQVATSGAESAVYDCLVVVCRCDYVFHTIIDRCPDGRVCFKREVAFDSIVVRETSRFIGTTARIVCRSGSMKRCRVHPSVRLSDSTWAHSSKPAAAGVRLRAVPRCQRTYVRSWTQTC